MRRPETDEMPRSDAISSTRFAMLYEPIGIRLEKGIVRGKTRGWSAIYAIPFAVTAAAAKG